MSSSPADALSSAPTKDGHAEQTSQIPTAIDNTYHRGPGISVTGVTQHFGDHIILDNVNLTVRPGELLAIAGGSGSGKTTLLNILAGRRQPTAGDVKVYVSAAATVDVTPSFGYVPQDDIVHTELGLERVLHHAARLRLGGSPSADEIATAVNRAMDQLHLTDRAQVTVANLSGGQRKRASIAVELLTDPHLFFLDEPTSGLDPATSAKLMDHLRGLTEQGTTVVMTSHSPLDLVQCDRVAFFAKGGCLAFIGTPDEALEHFGVKVLSGVYPALSEGCPPDHVDVVDSVDVLDDVQEVVPAPRPIGVVRQWAAVVRRSGDLIIRDRLTLAILLGSPAAVVAMMAVLFRTGTFDDGGNPLTAVQTLFWLAFCSFFFGVTYGLLQIVGEFAIFKRERFGGLRPAVYVAAKATVLLPLLIGVNLAMVGVLRALGRLPDSSFAVSASMVFSLLLVSICGLSLGLLASATVRNPAQATMALPLLCFPQVLFAGAAVPISEMASVGRIMSFGLANRWGFEAVGRELEMADSLVGNPAAGGFIETFTGSVASGWIALAIITVLSLGGTVVALHQRTSQIVS